ncbi:MAG TPA: tetratricopeptide repeat protein [Casimicrobiaceae bacterium]|jgi:protein O-GlcNAc transferase|nr:tetratricopeptide repeat protein [Casimicrobiaceae bacterium]
MKTTQQKMALALEHYSSGRLRDTEGLCREILDVQPQHAEALHLLGVLANRTGHVDAAVDLVRRAIANAPHAAEYYSNLGVMLTSQGRLDDAAAACREALGRYPDLPEAHYNLGNALQAAGQLEAAQSSYQQALSRKPDYPQAHNNLGNVLSALGSPAAAAQAYGEAVRLNPDYAPARSNLANALRNLGHLDEALTQHRRAVESAPTVPEIRSNMILSMYYPADADARAILAESRRWDQLHAEPLRSQIRPLRNDPSPERPLRIGFVSPDLRMHSVSFFLLPLLEAHDRENFHVTCYATNARADRVTERLRACSDRWRVLVGLSDDAAAQRIRDDRIDILVDLSNHTAGNRLPIFARNPAPVQVTYLGLTGTTGLSSIDYRLTDALVDPPEGENYCSERLVRLPDIAWCFTPLSGSPRIASLPALDKGYVTFGSFNNIAKITPHVLYLWARILQQVDASHLQLASAAFRDAESSRRFRQFFADLEVAPERIELLPDEPIPSRHLERHASLDIALDTFPFQGVTTTFLALWMGVPVVSLAGQNHMTRVGLSILSSADLEELAAPSYDGYVQAAVGLAADLPALATLRATLRQRMQNSLLTDSARFARNVEAAYRDMWRSWCAQR